MQGDVNGCGGYEENDNDEKFLNEHQAEMNLKFSM